MLMIPHCNDQAMCCRDLCNLASAAQLLDAEDGTLCDTPKICAIFLACHLMQIDKQLKRLIVSKQETPNETGSDTCLLLCADTCGTWQLEGTTFAPNGESAKWENFYVNSIPVAESTSWLTVLECLRMPVDQEKDCLHMNVRLPLLRSFIKQTKCRSDNLGVHHTVQLCKLFLTKGLAGNTVLRKVTQKITGGSLELAEWVSQPIAQISDRVYRSVDAEEAMLSECCMLAALLRVSRSSSTMTSRVYNVALRTTKNARHADEIKTNRNTCVVKTNANAASGDWTTFLQACVARKFTTNLSLLLYCCLHIEQDLSCERCVRRYSMHEDSDEEGHRVSLLLQFRQHSPRIDGPRWAIVCKRLGQFEHVNMCSSKSYRNARQWIETMPVLVNFHNMCNDNLTEEASMLAYFTLYQKNWRELWIEATQQHSYALPYLSEDLEDGLMSYRRTQRLDMYTMDCIQTVLVSISQ